MKCPCVMSSSVACPAVQYFYPLSHERHVFRGGKKLLNKRRVLYFSATFVTNISDSTKN